MCVVLEVVYRLTVSINVFLLWRAPWLCWLDFLDEDQEMTVAEEGEAWAVCWKIRPCVLLRQCTQGPGAAALPALGPRALCRALRA